MTYFQQNWYFLEGGDNISNLYVYSNSQERHGWWPDNLISLLVGYENGQKKSTTISWFNTKV